MTNVKMHLFAAAVTAMPIMACEAETRHAGSANAEAEAKPSHLVLRVEGWMCGG